MNLNKKIDEIRDKPEYIRLRYVWGAVGICMFFILTLWAVSVRETIRNMSVQVKSSGSCLTDFKKKFEEQNEEKAPSIKEILDQAGQRMEADITDNQQPTTNN